MRNKNCDRKLYCDDYEHNHCDGCGGNKPKGDLISREALKKAFEGWKTMDDYYHDTDCIDIPFSEAFDLIDNAPTVEPCYQTTSCLDCKNYDKENYYCPRFCEVIREATKEIKRQGEWIKKQVTPASCIYVCSECGIEGFILDNYCPNCGAEMRKGESHE